MHKDKKPVDIYLEYCQDYASNNLIKKSFDIEAYQISKEELIKYNIFEEKEINEDFS